MTTKEKLKKLEEICPELPSCVDDAWLVSRGFHRRTLLYDWRAHLEEYIEGDNIVARTKGIIGASLCLTKDTSSHCKRMWKATLELVYQEVWMDRSDVKCINGLYRATPQEALADVMDKLPDPYKWRIRPR